LPRTFTVGINPASTLIRGSATVTITQMGQLIELTAGPAVPNIEKEADTTAVATFTGATGLTLTAADFTVTPDDGAEITSVAVSGDMAQVTVTLTENTGQLSRTFTVGISSTSTEIMGTGTVIITQMGLLKELTATPATRNVVASATTVDVIFTGAIRNAAALGLTSSDFNVTGGASFGNVSVDSAGLVTVTVNFSANASITTNNTYVVEIASTSTLIGGTAKVTITHSKIIPPHIDVDFEDGGTFAIEHYWNAIDSAEGATAGVTDGNTGALTKAVAVDPVTTTNKVWQLTASGGGNRGLALEFVPIVTGNTVYAEFDYYRVSGNRPLYITFNDALSTGSGNRRVHGQEIITFIDRETGAMGYLMGNQTDVGTLGTGTDGAAVPSGLIEITGTATKAKWYTFKVTFDFSAKTVSFTVTDKAASSVVATVNAVPFVETFGGNPITYTSAVRVMRLLGQRGSTGSTFLLDNIYVNTAAKQ